MDGVLRVIIIVFVVALIVAAVGGILASVSDLQAAGMSRSAELSDPDGGEFLNNSTLGPMEFVGAVLGPLFPGLPAVIVAFIGALLSAAALAGAVLVARGVLGHSG